MGISGDSRGKGEAAVCVCGGGGAGWKEAEPEKQKWEEAELRGEVKVEGRSAGDGLAGTLLGGQARAETEAHVSGSRFVQDWCTPPAVLSSHWSLNCPGNGWTGLSIGIRNSWAGACPGLWCPTS